MQANGGTPTDRSVKQIDLDKLPCRFARHGVDLVPVPFGIGNCSMPCFECVYDGDIEIPEDLICDESKNCPAYQPVSVLCCVKHREEYFDVCSACEEEYWGKGDTTLFEN